MRRAEELPAEFEAFFANAKVAGMTAKEIVANPLMAEFVIGNGNRGIGMCVISYQGTEPEVKYTYLEESFRGKGIEDDIRKTLNEQNRF